MPRAHARLAILEIRSDMVNVTNFSSLLANRRRSRLRSLFSATRRRQGGKLERSQDTIGNSQSIRLERCNLCAHGVGLGTLIVFLRTRGYRGACIIIRYTP
jgi:hypothetical protein